MSVCCRVVQARPAPDAAIPCHVYNITSPLGGLITGSSVVINGRPLDPRLIVALAVLGVLS